MRGKSRLAVTLRHEHRRQEDRAGKHEPHRGRLAGARKDRAGGAQEQIHQADLQRGHVQGDLYPYFDLQTVYVVTQWTVTGLIKRTEGVLRQNNTMNIEQIYFR